MEVFLVLQIIIVVALIAVILVQKTSSDGFTNGSGSGNSLLNVRSSANLFTKATALLATGFMANSLWLGYMASTQEKPQSVIEKAIEQSKETGEKVSEDAKSILDNASEKVNQLKNELEESATPKTKEDITIPVAD